MASITTSLWDSIFTPGPTPILVRAMNISFLALITLLLPLIYVTQNIHVLFLTILAAGLWIAMQWFLIELEKAKKEQSQGIQEKKVE